MVGWAGPGLPQPSFLALWLAVTAVRWSRRGRRLGKDKFRTLGSAPRPFSRPAPATREERTAGDPAQRLGGTCAGLGFQAGSARAAGGDDPRGEAGRPGRRRGEREAAGGRQRSQGGRVRGDGGLREEGSATPSPLLPATRGRRVRGCGVGAGFSGLSARQDFWQSPISLDPRGKPGLPLGKLRLGLEPEPALRACAGLLSCGFGLILCRPGMGGSASIAPFSPPLRGGASGGGAFYGRY